jgi:hypothetical protein
MFDQLIGLILLGLGIKTTLPGSVKGDTTVSAQLISTSREQFRNTIQAQKIHAVEASQAARVQFREKLATITDAHKKAIVTTVDTKISQINTTRTDAWTNQLSKMSQILERIISQASVATASGHGTAAVDGSVASAQRAIEAAQAAVTDQAGKQYVVSITSENTLKTTVATTTRTLRQDITSVQNTISAARNTVHTAIQVFNQLHTHTP